MSVTMAQVPQSMSTGTSLNGQTNSEEPAASDAVEAVSTLSGVATSEKKGTLSNVNTAADGGRKERGPSSSSTNPNFGGATTVKASGPFPALGSTLGPYFSIGRLGKGTFCSIHKCINMHYHHDTSGTQQGPEKPKVQLVAAKLEIGDFRNSGVLGGEATMLQFLDSSLPPQTVPVYLGHLRGGEDISAVVMEYLPGQDMHWIRDWATKYKSRRIAVQDAVYLTSEIMLPLLQRMHEVGIVHRDVKPSNCVKRGVKDFCMVDFGLSKSIIVPTDSTVSDPNRPWTGKDWIRPPNHSGTGHFRKERPSAEFRGTSMYASVRVHQLKDYCPRDDMWSLMYVFCDLVSGGLPWMSFASNRDRESCQKLKELIHGEGDKMGTDKTERLLWGGDYHVALFKRNKGQIDPPAQVDENIELPEKLALSQDAQKVNLLRKAFKHLGGLGFTDIPDYGLIKECLDGFLVGSTHDESVTPIDWERLADSTNNRKRQARSTTEEHKAPSWDLESSDDNIDTSLFHEAEAKAAGEMETKYSGEAGDLARLPLELQYRIAQLEYNSLNHTTIKPHLALRDWFKAALYLLHGEWNSQKFERGGHRRNDDGYRREFYLALVEKCLKCASKFKNFRQLNSVYECDKTNGERKRRKTLCTFPDLDKGSEHSDLVAISQTFFRLRAVKNSEQKKSRAPPPRLSFG